MSSLPGIEVTALLCDSAQQVGGKLYILGAGWSRMFTNGPVRMDIAVYIRVPWHEANNPIEMEIALVNDDGEAARTPEGQPIVIGGKMEVGRPPGLRKGTALDSSFVVPVPNLNLTPGGYRWQLTFNGELLRSLSFEVVRLEVSSSPPRM